MFLDVAGMGKEKQKNKKKRDEEFYQVLLLGIGGVGKSSLVLQLVFNEVC